jgi:hypothetical protein
MNSSRAITTRGLVVVALTLAITLQGDWAMPPSQHTGKAYYYSPGMFKLVAHNRGMKMLWDQVDGFASVPDCKKVDSKRPYYVKARLYDPVLQKWGRVLKFQIVDCSHPAHLTAHYQKGIAPLGLEVDYATAKAHHFTKEGKTFAQVLGFGRLTQ